ncbi:MAG TPA: c-type cytochrome [Solimonas sp.]|nr:c-type cytochrome [Solimonas sp.]
MDHKNHDKVFFSTFAIVLSALFGIFFICIVAARILDTGEIHQDEAVTRGLLEERIKPLGQVITDNSELAKLQAAAPKREPMSGEQVYAKLCAGCHDAGVLGAPKTGDKLAWGERRKANGGLEGLVASAIKGKNQMPAKGGDPSLSDDEVKASVEHLLKLTGI